MPRRHVVRVAAATDEHLRRAGLQIQHRDLRVLDAAAGRSDREEHRFATRQELGPEVIAFPALAIGLREHGGLASCRGHALQTCRRRARREDDGPVRSPRGAARYRPSTGAMSLAARP